MMSNKRGFTLVEMMVVVSVFGILVAMSLPAFSSYVRSNRLSTSVNRLAADLQMARSTAIANGSVIQVVTTAGGYRVTDLITGQVIANRAFERGCSVAAADSVRFFPWGLADPAALNVNSCSGGSMTVSILPTGIVEVN